MSERSGESFEQRRSKLERLRQRRARLSKILPAFIVDRVVSADRIARIESAREETRNRFETPAERCASDLEAAEDRLNTARQAADPFAFDLESVRIRLRESAETIEELDALDDGYLTVEEQDRRRELSTELDRLEEALTSFEAVGREVGSARKHLDAARELLAPYGVDEWDVERPREPPANLVRYLPRRTAIDVAHELAHAWRHVQAAQRGCATTRSGTQYLDAIDETGDQLEGFDLFLDRYNDWYVQKETEAHSAQFTNIDAAGHDLSDEQRRAVLRDDKYNLVVAGAGSGKTVVLTHRAAYLTRRDDRVLPEDILAITYTKNAATVMNDRLAREFGITDIEAGTFHSIGLGIIQEETGRRPEIVDERDRKGMLRRFIRQEMDRTDSRFQREFIRFLRHYLDSPVADEEVEDEAAIDDASGLTTMRGGDARSASEKYIADFLFIHDIEYEYRTIQNWFEGVGGRGQYRPTFYLPAHDVVLAHHPVDTDGEPVAWADPKDSEALSSRIAWERTRLAEREETELVETYEFEHDPERLGAALTDRLAAVGVPLSRRPFDELLEEAYDQGVSRYQVIDLFDSFIQNAKQLNLSPDDVDERTDRQTTPRRDAFEACAAILFRRYVAQLFELSAIDFPDMLHRAADYMDAAPEKYRSRYRQILVDEFQDISAAEVRLLKGLVTPENDTTLFCVGDDWQSIYSFSGSDVSYFIDFAEVFDVPCRSDLTANYRCPATVVDAGDTLIANNDRQIEKTTRPLNDRDVPIHVHDLGIGPGDYGYREQLLERTATLIRRALAAGTPPSEILVLSRSKVFYEALEEVCEERGIQASRSPKDESNPEEWVRLYSVHKAKGDEAEHVIITHAVEDSVGFPSQVEDTDLLDSVRLDPEDDRTAEERRLFYVALTRTTGRLDIVSAVGARSRFLDEIAAHLTVAPTVDAIGNHERRSTIDAATVTRLFDTGESVEQAGLLSDWSGTRRFTIFDPEETVPLEADTTYRIEDARLDEYQGEYGLVLDNRTVVTQCDGGPLAERSPSSPK